jgi:hypothetical protein
LLNCVILTKSMFFLQLVSFKAASIREHARTFAKHGESDPIVIDKMNSLKKLTARLTAPFGCVYAPNKFGCEPPFYLEHGCLHFNHVFNITMWYHTYIWNICYILLDELIC